LRQIARWVLPQSSTIAIDAGCELRRLGCSNQVLVLRNWLESINVSSTALCVSPVKYIGVVLEESLVGRCWNRASSPLIQAANSGVRGAVI